MDQEADGSGRRCRRWLAISGGKVGGKWFRGLRIQEEIRSKWPVRRCTLLLHCAALSGR